MKRNTEFEEGEYRINARFPLEIAMALKAQAERNRRSINNELILLVERGVEAASNHTA